MEFEGIAGGHGNCQGDSSTEKCQFVGEIDCVRSEAGRCCSR